MILKTMCRKQMRSVARENWEAETFRERSRDLKLGEVHYLTKQERPFDLPPKPVGSIPGYSGFIPRKESTNVIGETYKTSNLQSAQLFGTEQLTARTAYDNILGPDPNLRTPDTSELASEASATIKQL